MNLTKRMKRFLSPFLSLLCLAILLANAGSVVYGAQGTAPEVTYSEEGGDKLSFANSALKVELDCSNGEFTVTDIKTGKVFYSNPTDKEENAGAKGVQKFKLYSQIIIDALDKETHETSTKVSYTGSVRQEGLKVTKIKGGARISYTFPEIEITVPLDIVLEKDALSARVDTKLIQEKGGFLVHSISVLPYFGAGGDTDEGYLLIPDGSGAIVDFKDKKSNFKNYDQPVYGEDQAYAGDMGESRKVSICLPVFGIKKNSTAFFAEITKGAESAHIEGYAAGMINAKATVYPTFYLIGSGIVTVGESSAGTVKESFTFQTEERLTRKIEVNYYLLKENAGYCEMAAKYRGILAQRGVGSEKRDRSRLYTEFIGGTLKKESFLGFYVNRRKAVTTVEQMTETINYLGGTDVVSPVYTDWTKQQIDGKLQKKAGPAQVLGSEKALKELTIKANSPVYLSFEPFEVRKGFFSFNKYFDAAKKIGGELIRKYPYKRSTLYIDKNVSPIYFLKADKLMKAAKPFFNSLKKKYGTAVPYSATLGSVLYTDFDKNAFASREELVAESTAILLEAGEKLALKTANAYALPFAEVVTEVPAFSSGFDLFSYDVPFYQLCVSGLVQTTLPAVNGESDTRISLMKALETGSNLFFRFFCCDPDVIQGTAVNAACYGDFSLWKEDAKALYSKYKSEIAKIGNSAVIGHQRLAEQVYQTVYENGTTVTVNYSTKDYVLKGKIIPMMGYELNTNP